LGDASDAKRADEDLNSSVVVDQNKRWLVRDSETTPDLQILVEQVSETRYATIDDEILGCFLTVSTGNTNKGDLIAELALYLCDRRGFTNAAASPRRPEPKQEIVTSVIN
jgi:hypothetical protein